MEARIGTWLAEHDKVRDRHRGIGNDIQDIMGRFGYVTSRGLYEEVLWQEQ